MCAREQDVNDESISLMFWFNTCRFDDIFSASLAPLNLGRIQFVGDFNVDAVNYKLAIVNSHCSRVPAVN